MSVTWENVAGVLAIALALRVAAGRVLPGDAYGVELWWSSLVAVAIAAVLVAVA